MKKIFSLFAAVLMAGSMMAENPNLIKFEEPAAAGSLDGQTFGSEFTLTITDTNNKVSVDANSATFGVSEEETVSFTHRLKTGGKSSDANKMTLVVPEEGMLVIYARTGNNNDTTRNFVIANGSDTIVNHTCKETDVVEGTSIYLPVVVENVPAGTYEVTYPANSINFYGFDMPVEEEEGPVTLGTFSISSAEIVAGQVGDIALGTNGYGSQAVDNPATWYTCAKGDYTFKGAKVCVATIANGGGLQMQGNANDVAKMGFFGNATAFNNIHSLKIVLRIASTATYAPVFNVYTDSLGTTTALAAPDTVTTTEGGFKKFVYTYEYAEPGKFFNIKDDLAGALYIDTIYVIYEKGDEPVISVADPVFSVAAGSYYDAQKVAITCETEGAEIHYTLDGTEPSAASALYTDSLTISVTTTVKAIAVLGADASKVVEKTYTIAPVYNSFDELVNQAGAPAGQKVVVNFSNVVIDSLYVSSSKKTNGVYLTAGGRMVEIYCYDVPSTWAVGGTISGTVKGEWKNYNGTWEVCPSSWEGITYTDPAPTTYNVNFTVVGEVEGETVVGASWSTPDYENQGQLVVGDNTVNEGNIIQISVTTPVNYDAELKVNGEVVTMEFVLGGMRIWQSTLSGDLTIVLTIIAPEPEELKLYIIGDFQSWQPAAGVEMEAVSDSVFTYNYVYENEAYFVFTTVQDTDWAVINQHRFAPATDGTVAAEGNNDLYANVDASFKIAAGNYTFTVDLSTMRLNVVNNATALHNTTVENVTKTIENGQVVIIKNGVRYNAVGAKL